MSLQGNYFIRNDLDSNAFLPDFYKICFSSSNQSLQNQSFRIQETTKSEWNCDEKIFKAFALNSNHQKQNTREDSVENENELAGTFQPVTKNKSIKRFKNLDESLALTDLGESSVLNILNKINLLGRNEKNMQSFVFDLDNSRVDENAFIIATDDTENNLSHILKNGGFFKTGENCSINSKISCVEEDIDSKLKIINSNVALNFDVHSSAKKFAALVETILAYENLYCSSSELSTNSAEIEELMLLYSYNSELEILLKLFATNVFTSIEKRSIMSSCHNFLQKGLTSYLSLHPTFRIKPLEFYGEKSKELHFLKKKYFLKKTSNQCSNRFVTSFFASKKIKPPADLIKILNFGIQCCIEDMEFLDEEVKTDIEKKAKESETLILLAEALCFKLLSIFELIIKIHQNLFKYVCPSEDFDIILSNFIEKIFSFLKIGEILRITEFLIRLQTVFDELMNLSLNNNSLSLFCNITREKVQEHRNMLHSISTSQRSISLLDKIDKNVWGKYLLSQKFLEEFERKCEHALNSGYVTLLEANKLFCSPNVSEKILLKGLDSLNTSKNYFLFGTTNYTDLLNSNEKRAQKTETKELLKFKKESKNFLVRIIKKMKVTPELNSHNTPAIKETTALKKNTFFNIFKRQSRDNPNKEIFCSLKDQSQHPTPYRSLIIMPKNWQKDNRKNVVLALKS